MSAEEYLAREKADEKARRDFVNSWSAMDNPSFVKAVHQARQLNQDWFNWTEFATALRIELDMRLLLKQ